MSTQGYGTDSEEEGEVEHESLKEDLRKAREVLARMDSQISIQSQRAAMNTLLPPEHMDANNHRHSQFTLYEDFTISKSREDIGVEDVGVEDIDVEDPDRSRRHIEAGRQEDRNNAMWPRPNDEATDLLDEGLKLLDSFAVASSPAISANKLTPSLAARLGPEVHSVRAKVQSLIRSTRSRSSEATRSRSSETESRQDQPPREQVRKERVSKENRVVEILDSDQEEGEARERENTMEVINIDDDDDDDVVVKRQKVQGPGSADDQDISIVEEKSHAGVTRGNRRIRTSQMRYFYVRFIASTGGIF